MVPWLWRVLGAVVELRLLLIWQRLCRRLAARMNSGRAGWSIGSPQL